jgi:excisionase family DNA binding protein
MGTATALTNITMPPVDRGAVEEISDFLAHVARTATLVGPGGKEVELPLEVFQVLVEVVDAMQAGQAITIAPLSTILTTSQAAEVLGVSRPTLVKLLEDGEIEFDRPGRHRRVRLSDLLEYRERRRSARRAHLAAITQEAVAAGMYEDSDTDYAAALAEARRRLHESGGDE